MKLGLFSLGHPAGDLGQELRTRQVMGAQRVGGPYFCQSPPTEKCSVPRLLHLTFAAPPLILNAWCSWGKTQYFPRHGQEARLWRSCSFSSREATSTPGSADRPTPPRGASGGFPHGRALYIPTDRFKVSCALSPERAGGHLPWENF